MTKIMTFVNVIKTLPLIRGLVAIILKVLPVNLLAALNFANVFLK